MKEPAPPYVERKEPLTRLKRLLQVVRKTLLGTKALWSLVGAALALLAGFALFRPQVSLDPDLLLNPDDPFSTQFTVTNQNRIFDVKNLHPACYTIYVLTDHNFAMNGLPPRPAPVIPVINPGEKTTIACPPWVSGFGAGAGKVLKAYIEIDVSYKQDGWPFTRTQRFPFKGMIDSKNGVHWTHRTPSDLQ